MPGKNPKAGPGPGEVCQRSRPSTRRSDKIEKFDIVAFSGTAAFFCLFVIGIRLCWSLSGTAAIFFGGLSHCSGITVVLLFAC